MLNDTEEKRKNELMRQLDERFITGTEMLELRALTRKGIEHLVFSNEVGA